MKVGRELDRLIATYVVGWKWDDNTDLWIFNHCLYTDMDIPNYSTEIADAWLVAEKFKSEDYLFSLKNIVKGTFTFSLTDWGGNCSTYAAEAETAPLAICLAALKAVGVE